MLEQAAPGFHGFDPAQMLADLPPLLPLHPGRRVALYRCSCGEAGCGVIAPHITAEDGQVRWSDFRNVVGVFGGPAVEENPQGGVPWDIGTMAFDRGQYEAEVRRARSDTSWETPRRVTARILRETMIDSAPRLAAGGLEPGWVSPATSGYVLCFWRVGQPRHGAGQVLLHLCPDEGQAPSEQAGAMVAELFATAPQDWPQRHGWTA